MHKRVALALLLSTFACSAAAPSSSATEDGAQSLDEATRTTEPSSASLDASALDAPDATAPTKVPEVAAVVHAGKRAFVVVDARADASLGEGAPRLVDTDAEGVFAAERAVDLTKLQASVRALVGRRVRLVGGDDTGVCEAVVGELSLLERVSPDGEAYARWTGTARDDDDRPLPPLSRGRIAEELWDMAAPRDAEGSTHTLVAALRPVSGDCQAASVAVTGKAHISRPEPTTDALESRALQAFRALPEHAEVTADYRTYLREATEAPTPSATWDTHAEARPSVRQVSLGAERLVWVSSTVGEGCGDFSAQLSALFRLSPSGELRVVRTYAGFASEVDALVADEAREGRYELFFPEAHVGTDSEDEVEVLSPRTFGCGC